MTKARAIPVDPVQQLAEANATIEVLRREVGFQALIHVETASEQGAPCEAPQ